MQKKIDADQMPRPLKHINQFNVRACIAEKYLTKSLEVPPSSAIPFISVDEGQCPPKYMRSTVINAPLDSAMQNTSQIPFGVIV